MAVNTLTLYMPGSSVGIQVWEGSQLHLILVSQGANSIPSAPGQTVRADPFPQYVDDDELAEALAAYTPGGGGGAVDSVNGQTGVVELAAADVGAQPAGDYATNDDVTSGLNAKAPLTGVEGVKTHDGTTGGGVRPTGYARVRWIGGTARPTNMITGDIWEHDA